MKLAMKSTLALLLICGMLFGTTAALPAQQEQIQQTIAPVQAAAPAQPQAQAQAQEPATTTPAVTQAADSGTQTAVLPDTLTPAITQQVSAGAITAEGVKEAIDSIQALLAKLPKPEKPQSTYPTKEVLQVLTNYLRNTPAEDWDFGRAFSKTFYAAFDYDFYIILSTDPAIAFFYDLESGQCSGFDEEGMFHIGFDYNAKDEVLYATRQAWMRDFGFNEFYDWLGGALQLFHLETKQIRFSYGERDYQMQIWKGKYFLQFFNGGEIGLYYKPKYRLVHHYDCLPLEEAMPMSLKVTGPNDLVYIDYADDETWWINMLRINLPIVQANELTLAGTVTFPDPGMVEPLLAAAAQQHPDLICEDLGGGKVSILWQATALAP